MDPVFQQLGKRKVGQWAIAYLAGAWVLYEVLSLVGQNFAWPSVILQALTVILGVGLAAVLVLAWYHGERGRQNVTPVELLMLAALLIFAGASLWLVAGSASAQAEGEPQGAGIATSVRPAAPNGAFSATDYTASVAVLPFESLSGDPADAHFAEGLTEEINNRLTAIEGLKVIARPSVIALQGAGLRLSQIADTFGVQYVVTGSIRRVGQQLRLAVQLADPRTDANIWAQTYDPNPGENALGVQDLVARNVAGGLMAGMEGLDLPARAERPLDPAAHEAFLSGQYWAHLRTREGLAKAIRAFARATEVDPGYARAYAALSSALVLWVTYDYDGLDAYDAYAWALALADHAVVLDPGLADAYLARGFLLSKAWAPADRALADFETALDLRPGSADVLGWYAHLLAREERHEESLLAAERAIELDPLTPGRDVGFALDALGGRRYEPALRQAGRASALAPLLALPRAIQGFSLVLLARSEECLRLGLDPYPAVRAICLHAAGRQEEARALIDSLEAIADDRQPPYIEAYYGWIGDVERSLAWLERSYSRTPNGPDFRIIQSGIFDPVRSDAVFQTRLAGLRRDVWQRVGERSRVLEPEPTRLLEALATQAEFWRAGA